MQSAERRTPSESCDRIAFGHSSAPPTDSGEL